VDLDYLPPLLALASSLVGVGAYLLKLHRKRPPKSDLDELEARLAARIDAGLSIVQTAITDHITDMAAKNRAAQRAAIRKSGGDLKEQIAETLTSKR
jgi:predicted aldo/keto reductase-like oxidoreductase